jgi:hypothetical protein
MINGRLIFDMVRPARLLVHLMVLVVATMILRGVPCRMEGMLDHHKAMVPHNRMEHYPNNSNGFLSSSTEHHLSNSNGLLYRIHHQLRFGPRVGASSSSSNSSDIKSRCILLLPVVAMYLSNLGRRPNEREGTSKQCLWV